MSDFETIELQLKILEEVQRIRRLQAEHPGAAVDGKPLEDEGSGPLATLLHRGRRAVIEHPIAAQAAFASLMAEGRRYAETEEGARWAAGLHGSELVRRLRLAWEAVTVNMFEEDPDVVLPSTYIETIGALLDAGALEDELLRFSLEEAR